MTVVSGEGLSDMKGVQGYVDSPYAIRRFMDGENGIIMGTSTKVYDKSEFKSCNPHSNSNWKGLQDCQPFNSIDELCFNMANAVS